MPATYKTMVIDHSSEEDDYIPLDDELEYDTDLLQPCVRSLGLSKGYAPAWTRQDAFREFYQNWKDAILASFSLQPRDFRPVLKRTAGEIQICVYYPTVLESPNASRLLIGYILFKKKAGSVELTNFKAKLNMESLLLGTTTKMKEERFAGCHGEGFKIAALIMRRNEHAVRFASNSYYWNFRFSGNHGTNFVCALSRARAETVQKKKDRFSAETSAGTPRGLTSNIWQDVTVELSKARGEKGQKITEDDFLSWLGVTIDINGPDAADIVRTKNGDLILDQRFSGRIYLKGLLVPGRGHGQKSYVFGYNFYQGRINRDRERLKSTQEEAELLASIWEQAMAMRGDVITDHYIRLFHDHEECLDISMIVDNVSLSAATSIWNRLRASRPHSFFYTVKNVSETEDTAQTDVIRKDLRKQPCKLPENLWRILRKKSLIRTPEEERIILFTRSDRIQPHHDHFFFNIFRALRASMLLSPLLRDIEIQFVTGANTEVDLLYNHEQKSIQIHQKWIDFEKSHDEVQCDAFTMRESGSPKKDAFFCDHIIEDLFELTLKELREVFPSQQLQSRVLRQKARLLVQRMPGLVRLSKTTTPNQLKVSWTGNESGKISKVYAKTIQYDVILHKISTCQAQMEALINTNRARLRTPSSTHSVNDAKGMAQPCSCDRLVACYDKREVYFNELDPNETYFALVSRTEVGSLFGVPPPPISPMMPSRKSSSQTLRQSSNAAALMDATPSVRDDSVLSDSEDPNECSSDVSEEGDAHLRSSASSPHSNHLSGEEGNYTDAEALSAFEDDEKVWGSWHSEAFQLLFPGNLSAVRMNTLQPTISTSCIECSYLNYTFEKDEYAYVRLDSSTPAEFIIYVHDIRIKETRTDQASYYLLVSKYSFLESRPLFASEECWPNNDYSISTKELLLHFSNFAKMREYSDAEIIALDNIGDAASLSTHFGGSIKGIKHIGPGATGTDHDGPFCRFAMSKSSENSASCITPIAPRLLCHSERPKRLEFSYLQKPLVFDLTANVLGVAEGFAKSGFCVHSGIGNDSEHNSTWKVRHPNSQLYDGFPPDVLEEFESGRLPPPHCPDTTLPRIALVAGPQAPFQLSEENHFMPSVDEFLQPLKLAAASAQSALSPHFIVFITHSAVLHRNTIGRFSALIFKLLELNYSVNLKLTTPQQQGLPQTKSILVVVASPPFTSLPWSLDWSPPDTQVPTKVQDVIGDITFANPRASPTTNGGFVCSIPEDGSNDVSSQNSGRLLYNHQTGRTIETWTLPLDMDARTISLAPYGSMALLHPIRMDNLTVREIARLQGFEDDFVFYGSETAQRLDALRAVPPVIAQLTAKTILRTIAGAKVVKVGGSNETRRASKRPRNDERE